MNIETLTLHKLSQLQRKKFQMELNTRPFYPEELHRANHAISITLDYLENVLKVPTEVIEQALKIGEDLATCDFQATYN